jgi:cation:H+ antiporter
MRRSWTLVKPHRPGSVLTGFSLPQLSALFTVCALAVWSAGIYLSRSSDALSRRWRLGDELGGMILLAVTTNLPEVAIVVSGAIRHDLGIATGNILGGIAAQTAVLVLLDVAAARRIAPLTYCASSPSIQIEGMIVITVLGASVMGTQLPPSLVLMGATPGSSVIVILWIAGLWILRKAKPSPRENALSNDSSSPDQLQPSMVRTSFTFVAAAGVTLVAGAALERASDAIAGRVGMTGVIFGSTVLALVTAIPQISSGLACIKLRDYQLAVSDIFGSNAFLPVLFWPASLISGQAVLPNAKATDVYLTGLGIVLSAAYVIGFILRYPRKFMGMGVASLVVLILYGAGLAGLLVFAN